MSKEVLKEMQRLLLHTSCPGNRVMIEDAIKEHKEKYGIVEEVSGVNVWDGVNDSITQLNSMLNETDQQNRVFFSDGLTSLVSRDLAKEFIEFNSTSLEDILYSGWKGYENMTDIELCLEMQKNMSSWIGHEENDKLPQLYVDVKKEIDEAIALILSEVTEKEVL